MVQTRRRMTSLFDLLRMKFQSDVSLLKEIENLSLYYHLLRPIFFKLSKQMVYNLESRDPKLIELDSEIWDILLEKKFLKQRSKENWEPDQTSRDIYLVLELRECEKMESLRLKLKRHQKQLEMAKNANQIEVIDHKYTPAKKSSQFKSSLLQKISKECSNKGPTFALKKKTILPKGKVRPLKKSSIFTK